VQQNSSVCGFATIPSEYEEWNRSLLTSGQGKALRPHIDKYTMTGKELVKVLEKLISGKKKK